MKIRVTEQHIRKGTRGSPWYCPVAEACRDAGIVFPTIFGEPDLLLYHHGDTIRLPKRVVMAIEHYDATGKMKPFQFEVKL